MSSIRRFLLLLVAIWSGSVEGFAPTTAVPWSVSASSETARPGVSSTVLNLNKTTRESEEEENKRPTFLEAVKEKPATLIAAPFVVLIGLDLLANIFFLAKRTVEYVAFGKLPSTEVWFSDNFFFL